MKTKEKKDLFSKNTKELAKMLADAREALLNLRLDKSQNKLKNTSSIRIKRREIAYVSTAIREKELENAKSV